MGKGKPRKISKHQEVKRKSTVTRRQHSQLPSSRQLKPHPKPSNTARNASHKVPFSPLDNVLLVGEGDFSFTLSLVKNVAPASVTATSYDTEEELLQKYPKVSSTIGRLLGSRPEVAKDQSHGNGEEPFEGFSACSSPYDSDIEQVDGAVEDGKEKTPCRILYGIDATKLSAIHKKILRPSTPFSKIVFNFPHVGGLSTDVNRQVRSNQQLLVGFFNAAKVLLSSRGRPVRLPDDFEGEELLSEKGQILVTLFEGEPYTLWNIRDLVRHCGLQVVESFKFPWAAYPGYKHARTIGDITKGKDRSDEGKRKGSWRGEEREARCYVIEVKEESNSLPLGKARKRQREYDSSGEE